MDKQKWLKLRAKNINSTESSALFNLSPYSTEFELYHRKKLGDLGEIDDNFRMKCGRLMEPVIAELAADKLGLQVEPFKDYLADPDVKMGSSFDYITVDGKALVECKNVDSIQYYQKWTETEAPPHIEVQVQHQMEVAKIDKCYISALVGGNDLVIIERERDLAVGAALRSKVKAFWMAIANGDEPEPNFERDAAFIASLYDSANPDKTYNDEDGKLAALIAGYHEYNQSAKEIKTAQNEIKAKVFDIIGDSGKVKMDGFSLACGVTKDTPPTVITPEMVGESYGGRKGYRQFRVTKLKEKK